MALHLPHSTFLHIPKTGGEWVRAAIRAAGIPARESNPGQGWAIQKHSHLLNTTGLGRWNFAFPLRPGTWRRRPFVFAFVRHPLGWYASRWAYRMETGWDPNDPIDARCGSDDFAQFVRHMVEFVPGHVSHLYELYVGREGETIPFVGRRESLAHDLVRALRAAGEKFDEAALRATPPVNEGSGLSKWKERCVYTPDLREAVMKVEVRTIRRFGYA